MTQEDRIVGTLRINTAIRHGLENAATHVTLGSVASEKFAIAHEDDIMFDVMQRFWHMNAAMVVVIRGQALPRATTVVGILTKEHIADSVAESVRALCDCGAISVSRLALKSSAEMRSARYPIVQ